MHANFFSIVPRISDLYIRGFLGIPKIDGFALLALTFTHIYAYEYTYVVYLHI